jgi:hypothetical protein
MAQFIKTDSLKCNPEYVGGNPLVTPATIITLAITNSSADPPVKVKGRRQPQ